MRLRAMLGALAVTTSAVALVLAGAPAIAGVQHAGKSVTGPEVISGAVFGKAANANTPHIPLKLRGVVNTSDPHFVLGNGKTKRHGIRTPVGTLFVKISGKPTQTTTTNNKTCRETFTQDQTFTVAGSLSTGAFAGASGPGAVQIHFAAFAPRYTSGPKKGQCNFNSNKTLNRGAVASFLASIVLTVRK